MKRSCSHILLLLMMIGCHFVEGSPKFGGRERDSGRLRGNSDGNHGLSAFSKAKISSASSEYFASRVRSRGFNNGGHDASGSQYNSDEFLSSDGSILCDSNGDCNWLDSNLICKELHSTSNFYVNEDDSNSNFSGFDTTTTRTPTIIKNKTQRCFCSDGEYKYWFENENGAYCGKRPYTKGEIAGIAFGVILLLFFIGIGIWFICIKKK